MTSKKFFMKCQKRLTYDKHPGVFDCRIGTKPGGVAVCNFVQIIDISVADLEHSILLDVPYKLEHLEWVSLK